jgi:RNA polymerase sigma-70 factor (ECF subfamily)
LIACQNQVQDQDLTMVPLPETRDSLILQVRDPANREAWERFVSIYRPLIYRMARGRAMQHADADDLAQQVLLSISKAIPEWERSSDGAKFRHWLRRIAANAILNALSRGAKFPAAGGSAAAEILEQAQSVDVRLDDEIEHEYQRQVYRRAAEIVQRSIQPETWQMFAMAVVDGQSTEMVATNMQTSIANVHAARSRVMRRLQAAVKEIEESES